MLPSLQSRWSQSQISHGERDDLGSWFKDIARQGSRSLRKQVIRLIFWSSVYLLLSMQSRTPLHGMVTLIFRVSLPIPINVIETIPYRCAQKCVTLVSLGSIKLMNFNSHQQFTQQYCFRIIFSGFSLLIGI